MIFLWGLGTSGGAWSHGVHGIKARSEAVARVQRLQEHAQRLQDAVDTAHHFLSMIALSAHRESQWYRFVNDASQVLELNLSPDLEDSII